MKGEIAEVDTTQAKQLVESDTPPLLVDVRERDEWVEGFIPGAVHIPRGYLESRVEQVVPEQGPRDRRLLRRRLPLGVRREGARELGYENVVSLAGGFTDWKRNGFPTDLPRALDEDKRRRYSRHLLIPEVGEEGQLKLLDSRSC